MIIHSIIVLVAFFACILGPIVFAVQLHTDSEDSKSAIDHHFLKG